jgi:hypothetical protein
VKFESYADALNLEIEISRYPNQNNRYTAKLRGVETKDNPEDGCLTGTYGNGTSPWAAMADYVKQIRGKILVVDAMNKERRQMYVVPKDLEL